MSDLIVPFKTGKKVARLGSVQLQYNTYNKAFIPHTPPSDFGHETYTKGWYMLGNDVAGDCYFAGGAHETMLLNHNAGKKVLFNSKVVLGDYSACTQYNPSDPSTDQGTDMQAGASYRRKIGLLDDHGNRHKIGAYVSIETGNVGQHLQAAWMFGCVGLGLQIGDEQQDQFIKGVPWEGTPKTNVIGHYVPLVAYRYGLLWIITWGRLQAMTPAFLMCNNDESICYLSNEMLINGKSLEGFDFVTLSDDLIKITQAK